MNELQSLNRAMRYIEEHLDGEIDQVKLGQISGCPAGLFGRVFSVLSGMPLGEYIRLRRLSLAAVELRAGQVRIIDLAVKYGYESQDAFSAAFKRYHGVTPAAVKKGERYSQLAPIRFSIKIEGGSSMNIRKEHREGFRVAGISMRASGGGDFSGLWEKLMMEKEAEALMALGSGQSYGLCFDMREDGAFSYMAGYDCSDVKRAEELGFEILDVPQADYAVLTIEGPIPQSIHQGWSYAWSSYFPQEGLGHAGTPDFELYLEGNVKAPDYRMELWIPVKRV